MKHKSALVVSPTHAEADRITQAIRAGLKAQGKLGEERIVKAWVPTHLTDAQKADPTQYEPGDLLQFHQNAPGYTKGSRLIVGEEIKPPTELAKRFEAYRPTQLALAVGDRVRVTAGGKTKDGKHRLSNGSLLTVQGFTKRGDIIVDHGWVIDRDFGHLTHGYVVTSHASQGVTVDKVFIGMSSESFPATYQRTAYVAVTRGKEQAQIFTDDKEELLKAISRPDDPVVGDGDFRDHAAATARAGSADEATGVRRWRLPCSGNGELHAAGRSKETGCRNEEWTMTDDTKHQDRLQRKSHPAGYATSSPNKEAEAEEARSFVRGVRLSAGPPRPVRVRRVAFPGWQQHVVSLRLAGKLAVQPF